MVSERGAPVRANEHRMRFSTQTGHEPERIHEMEVPELTLEVTEVHSMEAAAKSGGIDPGCFAMKSVTVPTGRRAILDHARGRTCLVLGPLGTYERYRPKAAGGGGCQDEWDFAYLTKTAARVKGLDIEKKFVKLAREDGFDIECGDAESFQSGEKYDVVLALHIIEHLGHPLAMLENAARHLNTGGVLIVETPNPFSIESILKGLLRGYAHSEPTHTCWIDAKQAGELGRRANLTLERFSFYTAIDWRRPRYVLTSGIYKAITKLMPRLGSHAVFYFSHAR